MTMVTHGERLRTSWVWMAILAVISLIGGVLALLNPLAATLAATVLAGWVPIGALFLLLALGLRKA